MALGSPTARPMIASVVSPFLGSAAVAGGGVVVVVVDDPVYDR